MHKVIDAIREFGYGKFSKKYYARIGKMINRYGEDLIIDALDSLNGVPDKNLTHLLNMTEKICQKKIRQEDFDGDWEDI